LDNSKQGSRDLTDGVQQSTDALSLSSKGDVTGFWTNVSVSSLAQGEDPITVVTQKVRDLVFRAVESGWKGPPFDPFWIANFCKIPTIPRDDIPDARLVPESAKGVRIEFNPNQPRSRVRFSLAHEI